MKNTLKEPHLLVILITIKIRHNLDKLTCRILNNYYKINGKSSFMKTFLIEYFKKTIFV
jgi:hypothetical protein